MANWFSTDGGPGRFVRAPSPSVSSIEMNEDSGSDGELGDMGPDLFRSLPRGSLPSEPPDLIVQERNNLAADLKRLFAEILDERIINQLTAADLTVRKGRIEQYFQRFENAHRECRINNPQTSHEIFIETEQTCMTVTAKIMTLLAALDQRHTVVSSTRMDRSDATTTVRVEIPVLPKVGIFTGNQSEWPEFRDKFLAQVHEKEHINPVDKMTYLQEACQGDAKTTLGPWPSTSDGYAGAWNQLLRAYNDNYHNVHGIFSRILATPRQADETHESLRIVVSTISGGIRQLRTMVDSDVERDQLWIHLAK